MFCPFHQPEGKSNSSLHSLPRTPSACKILSAQSNAGGAGGVPARQYRCKRVVFVCDALAACIASASASASSSRRSSPFHGQPTGRRLPAAAVAEPGARRKSGRRDSSGIAHRLLLPVQDGGLRAAERVAARAREGWGLAPRSAGSLRVRRVVILPDAAQRPA